MKNLNRIVIVVVFVLTAAFVINSLPYAFAVGTESPSSIEGYFQKAKQDYLKKNLKAAADEIRKGASYLKSEAANAGEKGKEILTESARELEKLADDVQKGAIKSVKKLESAFARAYYAQAVSSHIKSTESWARKEVANTGNSLEKATNYLERGLAWAGQKTEEETQKAIKESKDLANKLKKESILVADKVEKGLVGLGMEIEKLGGRIPEQE